MKRLELEPADLLRLRFAHSPMAEIVASAHILRIGPSWPYARWQAEAGPKVDDLDVVWRLLTPRTCAVPDFLTPPPQSPRPTLRAELATIAATPPDRMAADLAAAGLPDEDPVRLLPGLIQQLQRYFTQALAPLWPRIRAAADAEIANRTSTAAFAGPAALLADLHPRLRWNPDTLRLDQTKDADHPAWHLDGHRLAILPTVFAGRNTWTLNAPGNDRALWYAPRTIAALLAAPAPPPQPLATLLGGTRAAVLALLDTPSSTGDVADRLGLAPATASHHLTALRDAGLLVAERSGRRVNYRRTDLGDRLTTLG